jgi:hypothetical protein
LEGIPVAFEQLSAGRKVSIWQNYSAYFVNPTLAVLENLLSYHLSLTSFVE